MSFTVKFEEKPDGDIDMVLDSEGMDMISLKAAISLLNDNINGGLYDGEADNRENQGICPELN